MRNFFVLVCLMALCAVALSYPQQAASTRGPTTRVPGNPNNDLIRKGLIEKLCSQKYKTTVSSSSRPPIPPRKTRQAPLNGRAGTPTPTFGPTCGDFDNLSFEELINQVKGGLKPVNRRP